MLFKELWSSPDVGSPGKIDVPAIGLLIGEIASWKLSSRSEDERPTQSGFPYVLRATLSHVNDWMFNDAALSHRIVIEIGRGKHYRLETADDARTVLDGLSLVIEGVRLCPLEQSR